MGSNKRDQLYARQELLLRTFERLEQRDSQHRAAQDLCRMVRESLRVLALLTTPLCPLRQSVMAQPVIGKLLGLLMARLGDSDSRVRETAGAACGAVAEQMHDFFGDEPATAGDLATNPLLRGIFAALAEQNRELQAAAGHAFALTASHIQPIAPALLRQLLKALDSPGFLARAELWPAFAHLCQESCSGGGAGESAVQGLVHSSLAVVQAHIGLIVGVAGGQGGRPCGLLGTLSAPEWQARKAAAETLQALAVALHNDWDGARDIGADSASAQLLSAVLHGLATAKYDKVKPAREAIQVDIMKPSTGQQQLGGSAEQGFNIAAFKSPILGSADHADTKTSSSRGPVSVATLHAEQQRMAAALHLLTSTTNGAFVQLQQHIMALEARINAFASMPGDEHEKPVSGCTEGSSGEGEKPQRSNHDITPPALCSSPDACQALAADECSNQLPLTAYAHRSGGPSKAAALADLRASHGHLLEELQSLKTSLTEPLASMSASYIPSSGSAGPNGSVLASMDSPAAVADTSMDELFGKLVGHGGIQNELKLLRAMSRTGPVWEQLSGSTAQDLLAALLHLLEGKKALTKVLPWLWPLADESLAACFTKELKLGVLNALAECQTNEDQELADKVAMLMSTLKAVWSVTMAPLFSA
ncbi:hypothetical protein N2152v2_008241 [Parachlorella kessleri]